MEPSGYTYSLGKIVDQATIQIDNTDDDMTGDFVGLDVQGSDVEITGVYLDANGAIVGTPITLFAGEVDDWSLVEGAANITIVSQFSQWNLRTFSQAQSACRWKKFKGTRCGYAGGETWCDRGWNRCNNLGNTANFGGARWLPSIEGKEIWWGRVSLSEPGSYLKTTGGGWF